MSEFEKIIGYEAVKKELERTCDILKNFDKYEKLGVKQPAGILLYGDAGLGKTLMAQCFARETGWNVYIVRKGKPNGDFVKEISETYETAKNNQPAVVVLDDLDKYSNEDEIHKNSDEFVTVQSCIDDVKGLKVFSIATANEKESFPKSLLRAGRFDKIIEIERPKGEDCKKIIEYYLSRKKYISNIDIDEVAKILEYSSCAELEAVINEAGIYAGSQNKSRLDAEDIIRACMRVVFRAPESLSKDKEENIEMIAYHEAGHAVISEVLNPGSVNLLSVCKYEGDIGGVTSCSQREDYFFKKKYMEDKVVSLLGGRAATELIYGEIDVGANSDISRAFRIVIRFNDMYCSYGFDTYDWNYRECSNRLLERRENKVSQEMERYYLEAKRILAENKFFLDAVAKALIEKKTLRAKDILDIKQKLLIA
ncbi:MAG: AAA family ATPase [Clostridia bacterium]|nr:AAA family ATPase [Clostridia bacterium]